MLGISLLLIIVMLQRLWKGCCILAEWFLYPGIEEA
jgi:hypothetical protein